MQFLTPMWPILLAIISFLCSSATAADRDVSVYYYPWYDRPDNTHWEEGSLRTKLIPPSPPELGLYSSQDSRVIRTHLDWSEKYGIDNWICSWWGLGSFEDRTLRLHILPELANRTTKFCVYYEAPGLLGFNQREEIVFDSPAIEKFSRDIRYLAQTYFAHPNYQRIDGRPVLHLYLSRCFTGRYVEGLAAARKAAAELGHEPYIIGDEIFWGAPNPERIAAMDAITSYSMHGPDDFQGYPHQSDLFKHMSLKFDEYSRVAKQKGVLVIPNVMPGYNNRGSGGQQYAIPRQSSKGGTPTSTLREMIKWADAYIDPTLNSICLTSFNEWHEDTQIEPTVVTGPTTEDETGTQQLTTGYRYEGYGTTYLEVVHELLGSAEP